MSEIQLQAAPDSGAQHQTFLVGNHVYLRTFVPGDEKNATSWRPSVFPKSPELIEKWIKEELPDEGQKRNGHLAIVRKSDDVVIGSMRISHGDVGIRMGAWVDPLYGERGQQWLAEAVSLATRWEVDERLASVSLVSFPAHRHLAIEALLADGFVQTMRWREAVEINGKRHDRITLAYINRDWVDRIGNPLEKADGIIGDTRPVPAKIALQGDPPKQAVMIGERVYLRVEDKDDASIDVRESRRETETSFDIGRRLFTEAPWAEFLSSTHGADFPHKLFFTVCLRETDTVIGSVGLLDIDYVNRVAETGSIFFNAAYRSKGYGFEAKHLLLEYAFNVLELHMVTSMVNEVNSRSAAALLKQGYTPAGRAPWQYFYEGGYGDMLSFDLLASEWRALPRQI